MRPGWSASRAAAIVCFVLILLLSACAGNPRSVALPRHVRDKDSQVVVHVLNRLGFGPRPGDVQRVAAMGVRAYIDEQLHPETRPDAALEARLAKFQTLHDSSWEFARVYYTGVIQARKELTASMTPPKPNPNAAPPQPQIQLASFVLRGRTLPIAAASLEGVTPMRVLTQGTVTPEELRLQRRNQLTLTEMQQAKVLRAVYSDRQLEEVLTDFWMNHFNVFAGKVEDYVQVSEMERQTIRPYVFGRFRDMLGAVAKSPAMLVFLDNYLNGAPLPGPPQPAPPKPAPPNPAARPNVMLVGGRMVPVAQPPKPAPRIGLNENYARELMELHTLGVDGGYTQADVKEVARCFTGWTVKKLHEEPAFSFDPKRHDRGEKMVLGHRIPAGHGEDEGEAVLDIVARHPSTARFIATKLARRFVSDDPPKPLVDRAAKTFLQTDGDLRAVVQAIVTSPEFFAAASMHAKIKSPFEFIVSALRATDANVVDPAPIVGTIAQLGEPLYFCLPPTGYPDRADAWVNTGVLFSRMNIATSLASNNLGGVKIDLAALGGGSPDAARERVTALTMGGLSPATRATLDRLLAGPPKPTPAQSLAVVLGAPDFQRR
jgi:uncharacterized protein (DUF1800 family)